MCHGVPVSSSHAQTAVKDPSGVCLRRCPICNWELPVKCYQVVGLTWELVINVLFFSL